MHLVPAIDLLQGRVVRLEKGSYERVTVFSDDPVAQARGFFDAGAARLHVVDLDGARTGEPAHLATIEQILEAVPLQVQVGGGVRGEAAAHRWLALGARVVVGTLAIREPELCRRLCADAPGAVIVALDARGGEVRVAGWREGTGLRVADAAVEAAGWGAAGILYTDIERDGMGVGPDVDGTVALQRAVGVAWEGALPGRPGPADVEVIASGGVGTLDHLRALRDAGVRAAVCGRALYDGAFTLEEALRVAVGA